MENVRHEPNVMLEPRVKRLQAMKSVVTGSLGEGIFGIAAVVLAIVGLANVFPQLLLPIAAISIGASMLFEGSSIARRIHTLTETLGEDSRFRTAEIETGMTSLFTGGVVGIVLGILALLGFVPQILVAVTMIAFGVVLIFSSGLTSRLNDLEIECGAESEAYRNVTREAVHATAGVQFLIGLGAGVLGILAVIGFSPLVLSLVAALAVGFSVFANGAVLTARMSPAYRKC